MTSPRSAPDPTRRRLLAAAALAALPAEAIALTETVPLNHVRLGEGPPVVLIHGASGNLRDMTFRLAPMIARSHTVIAFDRPGHGLSPLPPGGETLGVQADLMRRALAEMGIARPTLIGHSYGGSVALAWALSDPASVSSLILLAAPSQVWPGGLGPRTDLLANPLTGPLLANAARLFVTEGFAQKAADSVFSPQSAPPGYLDHLRLDLVLQPSSLRANARQLAILKEQIRGMSPAYPGLEVPTEILHGTRDGSVPIDIHSIPLSRQLPRARLTRLEGIGHMIHQVAPETVLAALRRTTLPPR